MKSANFIFILKDEVKLKINLSMNNYQLSGKAIIPLKTKPIPRITNLKPETYLVRGLPL